MPRKLTKHESEPAYKEARAMLTRIENALRREGISFYDTQFKTDEELKLIEGVGHRAAVFIRFSAMLLQEQ